MRRVSRSARAAAVITTACAFLVAAAPGTEAGQAMVRSAQSWSYQLTGNLGNIVASNADVVVVDADHGGSAARFKSKPGGGRRAALAYLAVGEAEKWRGYWKSCCAQSKPSWLTATTQGWADNFAVKFWEPGWKSIVQARVREIFAKGYDGLYLDRVDTWERFGNKAQMIELVREISNTARSIKGDAAIIVQNGEELIGSAGYLGSIDGIAKEDLFHGIKHDGSRNSAADINWSVKLLNRAKATGKKIFVVEYLSGSNAASVAAEIRKQGFVPNFAGRNLGN